MTLNSNLGLTGGPDHVVLTFCDQSTIFKLGIVNKEWHSIVSSYFEAIENQYSQDVQQLISRGLGFSVGKLPLVGSNTGLAPVNPTAIRVTSSDPTRSRVSSIDLRNTPVARLELNQVPGVIVRLKGDLPAFEGRLWIAQVDTSKPLVGNYTYTNANGCGRGILDNDQIIDVLRGQHPHWQIAESVDKGTN